MYSGIPATIELASLLTIQIPKHTTVKITAVCLDSFQDLFFICKLEGLSYGQAVINEDSSLASAVKIQVGILMQLMPQMCCMPHPWEVLAIQFQRYRLG